MAYYLTSLTDQELFNNTLTGFLINLLKDRGPLTFEVIFEEVKKNFNSLRKPNGKMYMSNKKKSVMGALTANGVFIPLKQKNKFHTTKSR